MLESRGAKVAALSRGLHWREDLGHSGVLRDFL